MCTMRIHLQCLVVVSTKSSKWEKQQRAAPTASTTSNATEFIFLFFCFQLKKCTTLKDSSAALRRTIKESPSTECGNFFVYKKTESTATQYTQNMGMKQNVPVIFRNKNSSHFSSLHIYTYIVNFIFRNNWNRNTEWTELNNVKKTKAKKNHFLTVLFQRSSDNQYCNLNCQ